jgi:hypothetical protein
MGTGSKCVGQNGMSEVGDVLFDAHAEVIAKRSFQRLYLVLCYSHYSPKNRYLYQQLGFFYEQKKSIFSQSTQSYLSLKDHLSVHLYVSQTPCM